MKMFTTVLIFLFLSLSLTAGGQKDMTEQNSPSGSMEKDDSMEKEAPRGSMMMAASPVLDFHGMEDAMMLAEEKPTVLFFYASWCPTCQAAMKEIEAEPGKLAGMNLLIVDYDNSDDLKMKYGVTYQHTFVQISPTGEAVTIWNGGGVDEILINTEKQEM